ncbi:MAG: 50S ribosomal protein L31 [Pseudomonadota bacterium]
MKNDIHPKYGPVKIECSCGNVMHTHSTRSEDFHVDVCAACHPFYTGQQRVVNRGGRIDRFKRQFSGALSTSSS